MAQPQPIEEQTLLGYKHKRYYPVMIRETLKGRYRIFAKLGYGAYSTVWLAYDESTKQYTTVKVCIEQEGASSSPVHNEVHMLRRMEKFAEVDHAGLDFTRLASDIFKVTSSRRQHYCIALKPQGHSLCALQVAFLDAKLLKLLVRSLMHRLFFSVNWLHATCGFIYTGIYIPQNVLVEIEDDASLKDIKDAPIYQSRTPMLEFSGIPILTDFGQVRDATGTNQKWCMSDLYRAPEILLQLPWSFPVNVWSAGVMTQELLERQNLFDPIDHTLEQYVLLLALAQYIAYLGPPPLHMIQKSPLFSTYFDPQGNWIAEPPIPKTSLEDFVTTIPPGGEKDLFFKFIRKILTWDPAIRASANEIISDEWLMKPCEEMI
ncbi:kinase-like protein [Aspergillus pseudoustus]|uniref:Kinase-like protein n=1 Tax=Aspergillus pseudoustus TaxID=1810923 RepID=A0ABR4K947_9EURO